jgi:hypothetical protein
MVTGESIPMESADITLISGDLTGVVTAIALSKAAIRNIKQNLFWAFVYNTILIPVAAGVLFPFFGILLNPIFAAAAMGLSSVTVVTNALRLRRFRTTCCFGYACFLNIGNQPYAIVNIIWRDMFSPSAVLRSSPASRQLFFITGLS